VSGSAPAIWGNTINNEIALVGAQTIKEMLVECVRERVRALREREFAGRAQIRVRALVIVQVRAYESGVSNQPAVYGRGRMEEAFAHRRI
jgi:hypothetical protein